MLPGKQYTIDDLLGILKRRYWLLILPCAVVAAATAVVTRTLPDLYRSEAVILVVPQQVPDRYVRSSVTTPMDDRLQAIAQLILSRTRLERIIEEFNLYSDERRTEVMQDIVDRMRREIKTAVVQGDAFKVSYQGSDARTVQRVTAAIASLFIEESLRDRSVLAEGTSQFLEVQLADARRRLIEQEKKLEAYRLRFSGQLPTQVEANIQALQNIATTDSGHVGLDQPRSRSAADPPAVSDGIAEWFWRRRSAATGRGRAICSAGRHDRHGIDGAAA